MIWLLDLSLLVFLIVTAFIALRARDLLVSVAALMIYSFFMALMFAQLGAVDVAFTEVVLGAGVTSVFFIVALFYMRRRSQD